MLKKREQRSKQYSKERWQRTLSRVQRRVASWKKPIVRLLIATGVALVPAAIGIVLFSPLLQLSEIHVVRSDLRIDIGQVQRSLNPLFGKRLPFVSRQEIGELLARTIPDLKAVEIDKRYPSALSVRITLDPVVARLQIEEPVAEGQQPLTDTGSVKADYLTDEGTYVRYAPSQLGSGVLLPTIRVVDWGVRPIPGTMPYDQEFLAFLPQAERAIAEQFGQRVVERVIYVRARECHIKTPEYVLWFDLRSSLREQLSRYRVFLRSVGKEAAKEYVDLRLTDKVVYK